MSAEAHPVVEACPGGPLLLRGVAAVTDAAGVEHPAERPVVALCRCARSAEQPWCDGTHRLLPPDRRPGAEDAQDAHDAQDVGRPQTARTPRSS